MTHPTPAAVRAAELANAEYDLSWEASDFIETSGGLAIAFRKYIEHVSEVAKTLHGPLSKCEWETARQYALEALPPLILPEPVDPVREIIGRAIGEDPNGHIVDGIIHDLAASGLTIAPMKEPTQ